MPIPFDSSRDLKVFIDQNRVEILTEKNRRLNKETEAASKSEPQTYTSKLPVLGEYLPIRIINDNDARDVFVQDGAIYMKAELSDAEIHTALLKLYRNEAYKYLKPKVDYFAKVIGVEYNQLEIDDGRRILGLFHDIDKRVILSRRLMMMSEFVIDFLIVHELTHGLTFHHGERHDFEMNKILPDYGERDDAFYETFGSLLELFHKKFTPQEV